jgi:hypothetical protein
MFAHGRFSKGGRLASTASAALGRTPGAVII